MRHLKIVGIQSCPRFQLQSECGHHRRHDRHAAASVAINCNATVTMTIENSRPYKYVYTTNNQPDNKSNPNPNPNPNATTKQHAIVNIQLNIVTYPDKFIPDNVVALFVPTSIEIVTLPLKLQSDPKLSHYRIINQSYCLVWRSGNGVRHINEVLLRRARLVLGLVTTCLCKPPRSTQPGHPTVGRCNEYRRWFWPSLGRNDASEVTILWRFINQFIHRNK